MSDSQKIFELIKRGEDETLDFKKHITNPIKIARTIVAFANTNGGNIVIGVDDFGEIHKIDIQQERYMLLKASKKHCVPPVYLYFDSLSDKKDEILIVHVRKSKVEHCVRDEKGDLIPYVRVRDQSIVAPHARNTRGNATSILIFKEKDQNYLIQYLLEKKYITISGYMKMMKIAYPVARKSLEHLKETGILKEELINNKLTYTLNK